MNRQEIETIELPLQGTQQTAKIYKQDFDALMALGVSPSWKFNNTTGGHIKTSCKGKYASIARLIMDAGKNQMVRYLDGDKTNLRRDNLTIVPGAGNFRERDLYLDNRNQAGSVVN